MNGQPLHDRNSIKRNPIAPPSLWRAFTGYGLWAVCFTVLYTGHALGCMWVPGSSRFGTPTSTAMVTGVLAAIWMGFVTFQLLLTARSGIKLRAVRTEVQDRTRRFMVALTFIADSSAVAVTVISGLPIIMTQACV